MFNYGGILTWREIGRPSQTLHQQEYRQNGEKELADHILDTLLCRMQVEYCFSIHTIGTRFEQKSSYRTSESLIKNDRQDAENTDCEIKIIFVYDYEKYMLLTEI